MDDIRGRLKTCFAAVFPNLSEDKLETASAATTGGWDSVAMVTLISVVEEEFGRTIDLEDISGLNSFEAFDRYLSSGHEA